MKKYIKNLYLNENINASFVLLIVLNIILCVCSYYTSLQTYIGLASVVITIAEFFGLSMSLYNKQQKLYRRQGVNDRFIPKELYIKRDSWFQGITDYEGILILTGTSGIGKTYLLDQLMAYFDQNSICYYFEDSSYFRKLDQEQMDDKEYIILDQFERALSFDNIDENISVRNEFFGNIYKALDFNKSINIVWLDYSKNEIKEIKDFLQNFSWSTEKVA